MKWSLAQYVRQFKQEVSKITWPTRSDAMRGTITVIVMSVILALFLFAVNSFFAAAIEYILEKF